MLRRLLAVLGLQFWVAVCAALVLALPLRAQTVTGTLELGRKEPRPLFFEYSSLDEGLVTISETSKGGRMIGLYKYDGAMQREWTVPLFEQREAREVSQLKVLQDRILVFYEEQLPRQRSVVQLKLAEYGLDGKPSGAVRTLYQGSRERKRDQLMRYETSIDDSRMLLYGKVSGTAGADGLLTIEEEPDTVYADDGQAELSYAYTVLDAKTDSVYQGVVALDRAGAEARLISTRVGVTGVMFFLVRYTAERDRSGKPAYTLYRYNYSRRELQSRDLDLGGRQVTDLAMKADVHDNVLLAGIWSLNSEGNAAGVIYVRVPAADTVAVVTHADRFKDDLLAKFSSKGRVERGKAELTDFYLDNIVLRVDGGLLLMAEQFYVTTSSFRDAYGFWDTRRIYHYDHVLVVSISPEGTVEWTSLVAKKQVAERPDQLSYALFVGPEELYLFYRGRFQGSSDNLMYSKVGYDGSQSGPKSFFPVFRNDDIFYRKSAQQVSNTDGVLVTYQSGPRVFSLTRIAF